VLSFKIPSAEGAFDIELTELGPAQNYSNGLWLQGTLEALQRSCFLLDDGVGFIHFFLHHALKFPMSQLLKVYTLTGFAHHSTEKAKWTRLLRMITFLPFTSAIMRMIEYV